MEYKCSYCSKKFEAEKSLMQHTQSKHFAGNHDASTKSGEGNTLLTKPKTFVVALLIFAAAGAFYINSLQVAGAPATIDDGNPDSNTEDPFLGEQSAKVTIIGFEDFQCPFCQRFETQILPQLEDKYIKTGKVRFVFKDFTPSLQNPSYHPQSLAAHQAAACAGEQGNYWEFHRMLFSNQYEWQNGNAINTFKNYAEQLALDSSQLESCIKSGKHLSEIRGDFSEGLSKGISGTPSFLVNGRLVVGAQPYDAWRQIIESELAKK